MRPRNKPRDFVRPRWSESVNAGAAIPASGVSLVKALRRVGRPPPAFATSPVEKRKPRHHDAGRFTGDC